VFRTWSTEAQLEVQAIRLKRAFDAGVTAPVQAGRPIVDSFRSRRAAVDGASAGPGRFVPGFLLPGRNAA